MKSPTARTGSVSALLKCTTEFGGAFADAMHAAAIGAVVITVAAALSAVAPRPTASSPP